MESALDGLSVHPSKKGELGPGQRFCTEVSKLDLEPKNRCSPRKYSDSLFGFGAASAGKRRGPCLCAHQMPAPPPPVLSGCVSALEDLRSLWNVPRRRLVSKLLFRTCVTVCLAFTPNL